MAEMVTVGCKLPSGFVMQVGAKSVELNGLNKVAVYGADAGFTEVEKAFYDAWLVENKEKS